MTMSVRAGTLAALSLLALGAPALSESQSKRCSGLYASSMLEEQATEVKPGPAKLAAQYLLGEKYRKGICAEQDAKKSIYWYRRAADSGYVVGRAAIPVN